MSGKQPICALFERIRASAAKTCRKDDVGGEYAVYMMFRSGRTPAKSGFLRPSGPARNLDALPVSPYTSAVPKMDVNMNPGRALSPGMEEDFLRCRGAVN
jgi:hypothetical protein